MKLYILAQNQVQVDQVARAAGYTVKAYHGGSFNINEDSVFYIDGIGAHFGTYDAAEQRIGIAAIDHNIEEIEVEEYDGSWYWLIGSIDDDTPYDSEEDARAAGVDAAVEMAENGDFSGQDIITAVYLKLNNPLRLPDLGTWGIWDIVANLPKQVGLTKQEKSQLGEITRSGFLGDDWELLRKLIQSRGFDGIVYRNMIEGKPDDSYVVFSSGQVKSAEQETYDDAGNEIPLSERFNPGNPDIRY